MKEYLAAKAKLADAISAVQAASKEADKALIAAQAAVRSFVVLTV